MRWVALSVLVLAGCTQSPRESSVAQALTADAALPDLMWIDFVASGCATSTDTSCRGPAPLALHFGALAPRAVVSYRWTFGDGSADSTEATPTHVFANPGTFSVVLVASAGGRSARRAPMASAPPA